MKRDMIVSLVLLAGIISLYLSLGSMDDPRAANFPKVIIIIMGVMSALLFLQSLILKQPKSSQGAGFPFGRFLICFFMIIIYFIFMETLGFYLSAFLFFVLVTCTLIACADVTVQLYKIFSRLEALQVEINPLAVLANGGVLAVDSVVEIDNSALSRIKHPLPDYWQRIENSLERKGKEIGVTYVDLDGDIALISSGAGLGMASMDIIGKTLKPANFLETGGGITAELLYKCMDLVTTKKGIKGIFINIYGGINPIHEGAKGVVQFIKEHNLQIPIVAKALGNHQEETWEILSAGGVHVVTDAATEVAVARLVELVAPQTLGDAVVEFVVVRPAGSKPTDMKRI